MIVLIASKLGEPFSIIQIISQFRDDELHHLDTGLEHDAEKVRTLEIVILWSGVCGVHHLCAPILTTDRYSCLQIQT